MELIYDAAGQKQAFVDACAWAEDIHLCLAWIEPGDTQGPAYADLAPYEGKIRQAIVGLTRFQSHPTLLRRLHRASVLRLVSSVDGSFSPNLYVFRRGNRVRTMVASAPFTASRLSKPCESFVVVEAPQDDPFAVRSSQLLDRCRALAHVPSRSELDAYEHAWAESRSGGVPPDSLLGASVEDFDASALGTLNLVGDVAEIRDALVDARKMLAQAAAVRINSTYDRAPQDDGTPGGTRHGAIVWVPIGYWASIRRAGSDFELDLGLVPPWEVARPVAAVSLGTARASVGERLCVARADDGARLLIHVSDAPTSYDDAALREGDGVRRAAVIGNLDSKDLVQTLSAFAQRVRRERTRREGGFG